MSSVNKVILLGRCGRDPEVRHLQSGATVATITLATSTRRKDKATGEMVEETQWHRLNFFDRLAEICGEYVKKGTQIYVEGRLRYGKYTDKDGIERQTTDIIVDAVQLLGGKDNTANPVKTPTQKQSASKDSTKPSSGFDDMNDDIPF